MSRTECDGEWDNPDTGYLWGSWVRRAIKGKPGQKFLRELEAALVALPEKELIVDNMAKGGGVCALGAVALKRKLDAGIHRNQAEIDLTKEYLSMEGGYSAHEIARNASKKLKITKMFGELTS